MNWRRISIGFDVILQPAFASLKFNNNLSATFYGAHQTRSFGPCGCQNRFKCIQLRLIRPVPQQLKRRQTYSSKLDLVYVNADFGRQGENTK